MRANTASVTSTGEIRFDLICAARVTASIRQISFWSAAVVGTMMSLAFLTLIVADTLVANYEQVAHDT